MSEIIDFLEQTKRLRDEPLPIEKETVFKNIQSLPKDKADEYIKGMDYSIESLLLWKNIFSAKNNPRTLRNFIEELDEDHLERLNLIVLGLMVEEPLKNLKQIVEATTNGVHPTQESYQLAVILMRKASELDINLSEKAKEMALMAKQAQLLSDVFIILGHKLKNDFYPIMVEKLSKCEECELDAMISFCKSISLR